MSGAPRLSKRRREVLGYLLMGKTNQEVAAILGLRVLTVKNHVGKIIARLGAYNRQNAVYQALRLGILTPPPLECLPEDIAPPTTPPAPAAAPVVDDWLSAGNLHLSPGQRIVIGNDKVLNVTGVRFRLLQALLERPGKPLTRQHLLDAAHGDRAVEERTVDVHVHRIRATLRAAGVDHDVYAERGIGYRLGPCTMPPGVISH